MHQSKYPTFIFLLFSLFIYLKCGASPEPITYGKDECEHCRMMITENKYGAEIVTDKGKVYKFDSIECLIEYALEKNSIGDDKQIFLVTNFAEPGKLIDVRNAFYAHNDDFRSPMGLNVSAFGREPEMQKFLSKSGGRKLTWIDVIEMVKQTTM
jgi:copper chaperone NosL